MTIKEAFQTVRGKGITRLPIYEDDRENITGYVLRHDISDTNMEEKTDSALKSIIRPVSFVVETTNCLTLLTNFLKHRKHIAIVSDEFRGLDGLVTMEDSDGNHSGQRDRR